MKDKKGLWIFWISISLVMFLICGILILVLRYNYSYDLFIKQKNLAEQGFIYGNIEGNNYFSNKTDFSIIQVYDENYNLTFYSHKTPLLINENLFKELKNKDISKIEITYKDDIKYEGVLIKGNNGYSFCVNDLRDEQYHLKKTSLLLWSAWGFSVILLLFEILLLNEIFFKNNLL